MDGDMSHAPVMNGLGAVISPVAVKVSQPADLWEWYMYGTVSRRLPSHVDSRCIGQAHAIHLYNSASTQDVVTEVDRSDDPLHMPDASSISCLVLTCGQQGTLHDLIDLHGGNGT